MKDLKRTDNKFRASDGKEHNIYTDEMGNNYVFNGCNFSLLENRNKEINHNEILRLKEVNIR